MCNLLPFSRKVIKKKKHFSNFIKSNILNKSVKKWLFLAFCWIFFKCTALYIYNAFSIFLSFVLDMYRNIILLLLYPHVFKFHLVRIQGSKPQSKIHSWGTVFSILFSWHFNFIVNLYKYITVVLKGICYRERFQIFVWNNFKSQLFLKRKEYAGVGEKKKSRQFLYNSSKIFVTSPNFQRQELR